MTAFRLPRIQTVVIAITLAAMTFLIATGVGAAIRYHILLERQAAVHGASYIHLSYLNAARLAFGAQAQDWRNILLLGHVDAAYAFFLKRFYEHERQAAAAVKDLVTHLGHHPEHTYQGVIEDLKAFQAEQKNIAGRYRKALSVFRGPGTDPRNVARATVGEVDRTALELLERISSNLERERRNVIAAATDETAQLERNLLVFAVLTVALTCGALFWLLDRIFSRPVANAAAAASRVAENDLDTPICHSRWDGLRDLTNALETMRRRLLAYRTDMAESLRQTESARAQLDARVRERTAELAESEERFRLTFERAAVGVAHVSISGECLRMNDRFCEIVGYPAARPRDLPLARLIPPAELEAAKSALQALREGMLNVIASEQRMLRRDGTPIWVAQRISFVRNTQTSLPHYIFVIEDITKRKNAEAALQRSESRLAAILKMTPAAVVSVDQQRKICFFNESAEQIFGYCAKDVLGMPVGKLIPNDFTNGPATLPSALGMDRKNTTAPQQGREIVAVRKNRESFPAIASAANIELDGEELLTIMLVDISREKEAEARAVMARREAEYANRAKSTFLANMSHELRTPLNAVIGYAQMLSNQIVGEIENPRYLEYANIISQSGEHLLELISDILDISKIEAGELELEDSEVEIESLLRECIAIMRERAERGKLSLTLEAPRRMPRIRADRLRMKQIVLNLLSNAIKFTPAFGRVHVAAEITVRGLEIHVRDTGCGIAEEDRARILQPFGQARTSLATSREGTGLGLPLVDTLVTLHGGVLEIESVVGRGTTVTVTVAAERVLSEGSDRATQGVPQAASG